MRLVAGVKHSRLMNSIVGERANDNEVFDVLNENGGLVGQASRIECHKSGLFHQSVHVIIDDTTGGRMLLQKRADSKRIAPLLWDMSCAEHLQPGESFEEAAIRGMKEELGLNRHDLQNVRLLRPSRLFKRKYEFGGEDYIDNEFIACYGATIDVEKCCLQIDESELSEIKWVEKDWIRSELLHHAELYTPWFQDEKEYI
jgi:isopentenyl-diphosphate delta-isomerase type 1